MKWIASKDKLPIANKELYPGYKFSDQVLAYLDDGDIKILTYVEQRDEGEQDFYWTDEDGEEIGFSAITHWMPLPNQPKGVSHDGMD